MLFFFEVFDSVGIVHSEEWSGWYLEVGVQFVHDVGVGGFQDAIDHVADEVLEAIEQIIEFYERTFSFHVSVPFEKKKVLYVSRVQTRLTLLDVFWFCSVQL
jgi:preprotein translocase subunit SecE